MSTILLTFVFVFLAALPGRTTFLLLMLGSTTRPTRVLSGALPAFAFQCFVAVLIGQLLKYFPHALLEIGSGTLFLYFAYKFWREARGSDAEHLPPERSGMEIFTLLFMAELGDVSQLAIATKAAESNSAFAVFIGAVLAMSGIAVAAVYLGKMAGNFISPSFLQKSAAGIFAVLGLYLIATGALILGHQI